MSNYTEWLNETAKKHRDTPTVSEYRVIEYLKKNHIWYMFQVPIMVSDNKGYIADFVLKGKTILEVDGNSHNSDEAKLADKHRTNDLESLGYKVIRIKNCSTTKRNISREMLSRLDKVNGKAAKRIRKKEEIKRRYKIGKKAIVESQIGILKREYGI